MTKTFWFDQKHPMDLDEEFFEFFDENTVWCLNFYEKTDRIENDCIMYDEKLQSNRKGQWELINRDEFHVAYNPTWSDHEGCLC